MTTFQELELNKDPRTGLIKCPYCRFTNIYETSVKHHLKYTHIPNHPPNHWNMTYEELKDWQDRLEGKK